MGKAARAATAGRALGTVAGTGVTVTMVMVSVSGAVTEAGRGARTARVGTAGVPVELVAVMVVVTVWMAVEVKAVVMEVTVWMAREQGRWRRW